MLQVFFIVVGGSIGIFVLMWLVVYGLNHVRTELHLPQTRESTLKRRMRIRAGNPGTVWFTDIRRLERDRVLAGDPDEDYVYTEDFSTGCPSVWSEDLYLRRN